MPTNLDEMLRVAPADLPSEAVIFGGTPAMRKVRDQIERVRLSDDPVLIQGESGTGKETIARFLHEHSNRRDRRFVKLSCAAVSSSLVEREIFGGETESLARSPEGRLGLVGVADGGTLLLTEIGELSLDLQDKLLRVLQDGCYPRLGGREERRGRTRVVCASNVDLLGAVASGAFRADLFDRIEAVHLRLSPLRDRKNDIPQLCEYFFEKLSREFQRAIPELSPGTIELLKQWSWPGNLLELRNWIARAIILGEDEALAAELRRRIGARYRLAQSRTGSLEEAGDGAGLTATSALILRALESNRWNRRKTAEALHMSYRALLYKLRGVGIPQRRRSHGGPPRTH
ncbi:MAG TPA: sigma 54-interacting transcriptional regulator [Terracidiphilus sp.]|jgi:DNA-binding NtrC family response regulator